MSSIFWWSLLVEVSWWPRVRLMVLLKLKYAASAINPNMQITITTTPSIYVKYGEGRSGEVEKL